MVLEKTLVLLPSRRSGDQLRLRVISPDGYHDRSFPLDGAGIQRAVEMVTDMTSRYLHQIRAEGASIGDEGEHE